MATSIHRAIAAIATIGLLMTAGTASAEARKEPLDHLQSLNGALLKARGYLISWSYENDRLIWAAEVPNAQKDAARRIAQDHGGVVRKKPQNRGWLYIESEAAPEAKPGQDAKQVRP